MFDSHAHLNDRKLDCNLDYYLKLAKEAGISYINVVGYNLKSSKRAVELAKEHDELYATVGICPQDINLMTLETIDKEILNLKKLLLENKVIALGEIGLDYHYDNTNKELQKQAFKTFLKLAKEFKKPYVIHSRDAIYDTYEIIKESGYYKGVMHCYSGDLEQAKRFIDLGIYISISGVVTFPKSLETKEVAKEIDINMLLIETDCPYLAPQINRGKTNHPALVKEVAKEIARIRNIEVDEVVEATTNNAKKLFGI